MEKQFLVFDMTPALNFSLIAEVKNLSDDRVSRLRLVFKNGYQLSIIRGEFSYGGDQGLFEISPFDLEGCMNGGLFDEEDQGDDVLGYCNLEKVKYYVNKIGTLPAIQSITGV